MSVMSQWAGRTAADIAAAVRDGRVTAREVVAEHLGRIAAADGELRAFVRVREEAALAEADAVDRQADRSGLAMAGVPVAIKDNVPVAGEPMRAGSLATPDRPQDADHDVVARLRAAGAIVVGLTNLPELALYPFADSAFGVTRNPWDRRRTAGGSSGGSAAAVAAAMVPVALGNDGLGSIRIPAAACGLVGVKPGAGLVTGASLSDGWGELLESGPLATTVADAALMLGVIAGTSYDLADPPRLRIAVSVKATGPGVAVHRGLRNAARDRGQVLAGLGHAVEPADPPYPLWGTPDLIARWFTVAAIDSPGDQAAAPLEPRTRRHARAGRLAQRLRPPRADGRARVRAIMEPFFATYDVLAMPSLAWTCPAARRWGEGSWLRSVVASLRFAPMTGIWNLAGFPAVSVPAASVAGMPGSVQLVAGPGKEQLLLSLAAELERAAGWSRHAPAFDSARS